MSWFQQQQGGNEQGGSNPFGQSMQSTQSMQSHGAGQSQQAGFGSGFGTPFGGGTTQTFGGGGGGGFGASAGGFGASAGGGFGASAGGFGGSAGGFGASAGGSEAAGGFGSASAGGFGGASQPFAGGFGAPSAGPIVFGGGAASGGATAFSTGSQPSFAPLAPSSGMALSGGVNANEIHAEEMTADDERKKSERAARFQTSRTAGLSAGAAPFAPRPAEEEAPAGQQSAGQQKQRKARKKNIVGTCEDMCPAQERERRQNMSDIQIFERVQPDNMNLTSAELAVKRFARTVDDPHPSEFRTRGALARTMAHLRGLLDREDVRFGLVHKFLWDRYRSVRQDLYIQGITDEFAIGIFEEIVRFHVMCEHELCGEDQSVTDMEGFNSHLNMEQMNKALISLNDMYEKAAERGAPCPTEPEFRAYHLLSVMAQHGKFKGDQQAFLSTLQALRVDVREDERVQWVLKLRNAYYFGNFARFFRLVGEAPYLLACLAHVYFPRMRATCFQVMSETCAKQQVIEASWLVRTLMLDDTEEALNVAKAHGFLSSLDSGDRDPVVVLTKGGFEKPETVVRYPSKAVSAKSGGMRRSDLILTVAEESEEARRARLERMEQMKEVERQRRVEEEERRRLLAEEAEARRRREEEEATAARERRLAEVAAEEAAEARRRKEAQEAEEDARRRKEAEEAERRRAQEEEAARLRLEEARRRKAAEEEMRRMAEEERRRAEEQKRLEELRQKELEEQRRREEEERRRRIEEERRRRYLLERLREAILARRHWDMWLEETRRRLAEKERRRIAKLNLKGCRVGVQVDRAKRRRKSLEAVCGAEVMNSGTMMTGIEPSAAPATRSILEIVEPLLLEKTGESPPAEARGEIGCPLPTRAYWKLTVLTRCQTVADDPLTRRLRARAFQDCSHSMDLDGARTTGTTGMTGTNDSSPGRARGELVYQESSCVSSCVHFVPGWNAGGAPGDVREGLAEHLAGASGLVLVDVDADTVSRALLGASRTWKGPKLPVLVVAPEGTPPSFTMESGFHVRTVPMDDAFPDALRWLAGACPPQPSFAVTTLKDCISQAIRSMVYSSSREEAAIELVLSAIDDAHESVEARWQWPPREFELGHEQDDALTTEDELRTEGDRRDRAADPSGSGDAMPANARAEPDAGALNEWWTGYERLVRAVRSVFQSMDGKTGLSLLAVNRVLERYDEPLVLPWRLRGKYDAMFELSTSRAGDRVRGKENAVWQEGQEEQEEGWRAGGHRGVPTVNNAINNGVNNTINVGKPTRVGKMGEGATASNANRATLRQRLAALDEQVELLRMQKEEKDRKRGMLFGLLPKFW